MATLATSASAVTPRRIVLVDFDWEDADLLPELLKRPGVAVRLVAGERHGDPGMRVAELCGLPRTSDLADLTREIFDLALVGERSSRRTQLESLLVALGTPCQTPQEFLNGATLESERPTAIEAPLALHAAAFETTLAGHDADDLVDQALPDFSDPSPLRPVDTTPVPTRSLRVVTLEDFPSAALRAELESVLRDLVQATGAGRAEMHAGGAEKLQLVAEVGPEDRLLKGLIDLAEDLGTPQIVERLSEPERGKTWGAWPIRTAQRRGVIAAAGIDPGRGWTQWQKMVEDIHTRWDEEDRRSDAALAPLVTERESGWLSAATFDRRVEAAIERHRLDGSRYELHRLDLPDAARPVGTWSDWIPGQVRDSDSLHRAADRVVLVLHAGSAEGYTHLRRRLLALWDAAWREANQPSPAPSLVDQHVALASPEDVEAFLTVARAWTGRS